MALGFAEAGADVVVVQPQDRGLRAVAEEIRALGRRRSPWPATSATGTQCAALVDATVAEFGRIDVLVNNAGIAPVPPSLLEGHRRAVRQDDRRQPQGPAAPDRARRRAHAGRRAVINISSKASTHPSPFTVVYAAAKAGLNALTRPPPQEFGPRGIRVNGIVCGTFHTDSLDESCRPRRRARWPRDGQPRPHRRRRRDRRHRALPRQHAGSYLTGELILLDGG